MADEFAIDIPVNIKFTQKGLAELTAAARASINSVASAGLGGDVGASGGVGGLQSQLQKQAAAYISAAKSQAAGLPPGQQQAAFAGLQNVAKDLAATIRQVIAQVQAAVSPEGTQARVDAEISARNAAARDAVVRNSTLLGQTPPNVFQNKDILGTQGGQFISTAEAAQQREAFAAMQEALLAAAQTLREIAAIDKQGRAEYVASVAEAVAAQRVLNAQIKAEVTARLAANDEYVLAVAAGSLAQREVASRIKEQQNSILLGNNPVLDPRETQAAGGAAAEGQTKLGEAATAMANSIDAQALLQREASNKVTDAMLAAAASLEEIAALDTEVQGGRAAYVATQAEAASQQAILAQEIETETAERLAGNDAYLALQERAAAAQAKLAGEIETQTAKLAGTGLGGTAGGSGAGTAAANASLFQKLQAKIFNLTPTTPDRDPSSFPGLGQFVGQKALTTLGFAAPGLALYGGIQGIRNSVTEANKLQTVLVNLQEEFKAADDAGDFPKAKAAIIALSNSTGVAASDIAQIAVTFKGAFGDTARAVDETTHAVQLAIATGLGIGDITNTVLAVDQAFGVTAQNIGDVTLSLQELTGVSAKETISALGTLAPVADQIGLSLKQTATLLTLSEQLSGRSASTIAENFSRILPAIQKNGVAILNLIATVPGLDKQFQALGQDLNSGSEGKFFTDLTDSFGKLGPVAQNTVIELLGGRREAGALIPVLQNAAKYNDLLAKATDNNGKTQAYAAAQLATLSKQLSVLKTNLQNIVGDLLRSGLAQGFGEALKVVEFLLGGVQQIESVLKEVNAVTDGFVGKLAAAAILYKVFKGGQALFSGGVSLPTNPLVAGATEASNILVAGATRAAAALVEGGAAAGAESASGGALGGLGAAGGAAAGGAVTDIFGGSTAAISILPEIPVLPVALATLAGFAVYKSVVDDAKKANKAASAEADAFTKTFLAQRKDLDDSLLQFIAGQKNIAPITPLKTADLASFSNTAQLAAQSKDLRTFSDNLQQQAEDAYVKKYKDTVLDPTPAGDTGPVLYSQSPTLARLFTHLPIVGGLFNNTAKRLAPAEFTKQIGRVGDDVRANVTKNILVPLIDQYIKDVSNNAAKVLINQDGKGVDANAVVGQVKIPTFDPKGRAQDASTEEIAKAKAQLEGYKKLLATGTKKDYETVLKGLDATLANPATAPSLKNAEAELRSQINQAQAASKSNDTETDLATQKQLVDAGAESMKTYLTNLGVQIGVLTQLQDDGPLIPQLKLQLAQNLKEENDQLNTLADQAQSDADFLAGLVQSGPQLAETKAADALAKFRGLPKNDPARVQAAQAAIQAATDAQQEAFLNLTPGDAYRQALAGVPLPSDAVAVLVEDQKKNQDTEKATAQKRIDFYKSEIERLSSSGSKDRGDSVRNGNSLASARQGLAEAQNRLNQLNAAPTALSPDRQQSKDLADAERARVKAAQDLRAGDDPVKQAQSAVADAQANVEEDIQFYGKVLPDDAQAFYKAYDDLLFAKAQAAEQEKERAIQLQIDASQDPATKAALEKSLAATQAAYAASIGKIPGHSQAAKDATNQAQQTQQQATQDQINQQNAIAKAKLDFAAASTQDAVQLARIAIAQADEEAREAQKSGNRADQLEAAAHKLQAEHQLADALSGEQDAFDSYLTAIANFHGDIVAASSIALQESIRHLQEDIAAGKGKTVIDQDRAKVVDAAAAVRDSTLQAKEATIDFNLQMKQISTAQAIALYTALLSSNNTIQEQRDLLLKIQQLKQTLNQDLQFNLPTDLTLPTLYTARRFVQGGGAEGFANNNPGPITNHADNRQIVINVNGAGKPTDVANAVVAALNGPARYGARPRTY